MRRKALLGWFALEVCPFQGVHDKFSELERQHFPYLSGRLRNGHIQDFIHNSTSIMFLLLFFSQTRSFSLLDWDQPSQPLLVLLNSQQTPEQLSLHQQFSSSYPFRRLLSMPWCRANKQAGLTMPIPHRKQPYRHPPQGQGPGLHWTGKTAVAGVCEDWAVWV
jgi:hypothetical protein